MDLARIIDNKIVIIIDCNTLPYVLDFYNETHDSHLKLENLEELLRDILYELNNEEENGDTLIHKMLDKAFFRAIENGSEGIDCDSFD